MRSSLQLVNEQFPTVRERTTRLFDADPIFRELCDDYVVCTAALARHPATHALHREYAALRLRLETELLRHLQEAEQQPAPRGPWR
jgi:hypothetical protein